MIYPAPERGGIVFLQPLATLLPVYFGKGVRVSTAWKCSGSRTMTVLVAGLVILVFSVFFPGLFS